MHGPLASWERGPLARNALMALLKQIFHCLQLPKTATVQTPPMLNEYFGVGVTSEPRMASAAVEPWMGSSTDEHLPRSTTHAGLSFLAQQSSKDDIRMPYLVGIAVPSTGHPDPIRGCVIHDSLVATPTRHSLTNSVVCEFFA